MSRPKKRPNACPIGRGCMHCHLGSELGNGKDRLPPSDRRRAQDDGDGHEDTCPCCGECPAGCCKCPFDDLEHDYSPWCHCPVCHDATCTCDDGEI